MAYLSLLGTENLNENKDSIPSGLIAIWSGSISNIPEGWVLCNGENNTPDLRDRFVLSAGNSYNVGTTGGETAHTLTVSEMPSHDHTTSTSFTASKLDTSSSGNNKYLMYSKSAGTTTTEWIKYNTVTLSDISISKSGSGNAHNNMPPYYALCYIMKT